MKKTYLMAFMVGFLTLFFCSCSESPVEVQEDYVVICDETTCTSKAVSETSKLPSVKDLISNHVKEHTEERDRDIVNLAEEECIVTDVTSRVTESTSVTETTTTTMTTTQAALTQAASTQAAPTQASSEEEETCTNPPYSVTNQTDSNFTEVNTAKYYTVEAGDTWSGIANMYQISAKLLSDYNNMLLSDVLHPGDILAIPTAGEGYIQIDVSEEEEEITTPDYSVLTQCDNLVQYGSETKVSWSAASASFTNMEIACGVLSDEIAYIPPGGKFSWLSDVGPCNDSPYVSSDSYSGGKVVKARGGGICMVASALKVAAMNAGCVITETHVHSLPVPYNSREKENWQLYESTIDESGQDLRFYNPSATTGLTIRAYVDRSSHSCTVELIPDLSE